MTAQLYFSESVSSTIYTTVSPYSSRGIKDTSNAGDGIYRSGGDQLLVQVQQDGSGYVGTVTLSIAANAATEFVSWVPVVLSSPGAAGSVYTSELAITNRAATAATVGFSYTASSGGGSGSVSSALVLPAGQQQIVSNAIDTLRTAGICDSQLRLASRECWQFASPVSQPLPRVLSLPARRRLCPKVVRAWPTRPWLPRML